VSLWLVSFGSTTQPQYQHQLQQQSLGFGFGANTGFGSGFGGSNTNFWRGSWDHAIQPPILDHNMRFLEERFKTYGIDATTPLGAHRASSPVLPSSPDGADGGKSREGEAGAPGRDRETPVALAENAKGAGSSSFWSMEPPNPRHTQCGRCGGRIDSSKCLDCGLPALPPGVNPADGLHQFPNRSSRAEVRELLGTREWEMGDEEEEPELRQTRHTPPSFKHLSAVSGGVAAF
jgi:hypothetical protein